MAPPPPSTTPPALSTSRVITLSLKVAMFVLLFISLIVLVTATATIEVDLLNNRFSDQFTDQKVNFDDVSAYRYMLASILIGLVYSLLQIAFSVYHIVKGNPLISGVEGFVFEFYGDKVISYVVATGSAAGFGATKDLKALADASDVDDFDAYFDQAYASASMLLLAFLCSAILSVFSSYSLPKTHVQQGQCEKSSTTLESESGSRHTSSTPAGQLELEGQQQQQKQNAHQNGNGQYPSTTSSSPQTTGDGPTNLDGDIEPASQSHPAQPES